MRALAVLITIAGWILFKYFLLGSVSFVDSFKYGMFYHYIALIILAFGSAYIHLKSNSKTPTFLEGFKYIAKATIGYAVSAAIAFWIWYHKIMALSTANLLAERIKWYNELFDSEESFKLFAEENGKSQTLSEWISNNVEIAELMNSAGTDFTITLLAYVMLALFVSLIVSILWTKVWFVQHPSKKVVK